AVRATVVLHQTPDEAYHALLDGDDQLEICHVFDYLLLRSWFQSVADNGAMILCWAAPARPRTIDLGRNDPGIPGTSIELVVAANSKSHEFEDLKGARLALPAHNGPAPGTFLTQLLQGINHPLGQAFFGSVNLRRYPKDAVIDLLKGKADAAC